MNQEELTTLLSEIEKFIIKEIKNFIPDMDLFPQKQLLLNLNHKFSELGLMNIPEMEDFHLSDTIMVLQTISRHCAGLGAYLSYAFAGKMLKGELGLPEIDKLTAICLYEENDLNLESGNLEFSINLNGSRIMGKKKSVMLAPDADDFIVFGKMSRKYAVLLVQRQEGIKIGNPVSITGVRVVPCADVFFETKVAGKIKEIRDEHIFFLFGILSLFLSACATATAKKALEEAWKYAQVRYQGGKNIREYDAIRLMYEKNYALVQSAIKSVMKISEQSLLNNPEFLRSAIEIKISSSEICVNAALDAIQMLGGYGYMRDFGIEKRFRDAVALSLLPADNLRLSLFLNSVAEEIT